MATHIKTKLIPKPKADKHPTFSIAPVDRALLREIIAQKSPVMIADWFMSIGGPWFTIVGTRDYSWDSARLEAMRDQIVELILAVEENYPHKFKSFKVKY